MKMMISWEFNEEVECYFPFLQSFSQVSYSNSSDSLVSNTCFGHTTWLAGSQFPDQGLNLGHGSGSAATIHQGIPLVCKTCLLLFTHLPLASAGDGQRLGLKTPSQGPGIDYLFQQHLPHTTILHSVQYYSSIN